MNDSTDPNNDPAQGLHVDADWKAEARKEKERMAAASASGPAEAGGDAGAAAAAAAGDRGQPGQLPPADFQTLVSTMVTQAMYAMGMIPDPQTGERVAILDLARHHIDMLGVLEDKTQGNVSDEEQKLLAGALYELRMQYVQLSQQAVQQQTGSEAGGGPGGSPGIQMPGQ